MASLGGSGLIQGSLKFRPTVYLTGMGPGLVPLAVPLGGEGKKKGGGAN